MAIGFFGLGLPEILILAMGLLCFVGAVLAVIAVVWAMRRRDTGEADALRREVKRLRDELDRMKNSQ